MILAQELRIGNAVNFMEDGTTFIVTEISANGIAVKNDSEETWIELDQFSGIPLSPEILEKSGFSNVRDVHWCVPNREPSKSFEVCLWSDHVSYTMSNTHDRELKYVHELQNLYFALTGEELKIEL